MNTIVTWVAMKPTKNKSTTKCTVRMTCRLRMPLPELNLLTTAGDCSIPVITANGAATKRGAKYASICKALYCDQPEGGGKSSDRYWRATDNALGNTSQDTGTTRCH